MITLTQDDINSVEQCVHHEIAVFWAHTPVFELVWDEVQNQVGNQVGRQARHQTWNQVTLYVNERSDQK
jgi:hypothetical protein